MRRPVAPRLWLALMLLGIAGTARALPDQILQEGLVLDGDGFPVEGEHTLIVRLYTVENGGGPIFEEVHRGVEFFQGYYAVAIGSIEALDPTVFLESRVYLGVTIDGGDELAPRTPLRKVPAAMVSDVALSVVGEINPDSLRVGGRLVIDADGQWVGDPTGLRGPRGPVGPAGAQGPPGPQGEQGPEGPRGPRGPAGASGADGQDGQDGNDGNDGSPDTPGQVLAKLVGVDGQGSGLDSDRLDGLTSNQFLRRDLAANQTPNVTSRLRVRGDHLEVGDRGFQTGIQFLNFGTKHAGLRYDGQRSVIIEDASSSHDPDDWYGGGRTDLNIRNGNLQVSGSGYVSGGLEVGATLQPSIGGGARGIVWPGDPWGGGGDVAWMRYIRDGGGENTALDIGIANNGDDNIRLNASGGVDVIGSGDLRVARHVFVSGTARMLGNAHIDGQLLMGRDNRAILFLGEGDDTASVSFVREGNGNHRLQLYAGNDSNEEITLHAPGGVYLDGNGTGRLGLEFPNNRWGGAGDDAWLRYYSQNGEDTRLELGIGNEGNDDIVLNASGGVTVAGSGDLVVNRNLIVRGECQGCESNGGYRPLLASAGGGDNGIVFPTAAFGGGDDAWIRYMSQGGTNTVLQIGINNDTNDEIQLYSGNMVMLNGYGNELGIEFPANIWGGGDHAYIRYLREGGSNTRLQIVNTNDSDDEIELYSNAMTRISGNGSNPIGFQFQSNRWGGGGDEAYLRYRSEGGENTVLELGVANNGDDNMVLRASGGITLEGNVHVTGNLTGGNLPIGGYRPVYASAGGGDNGIVWPTNAHGGGDDAWIRYLSEGGSNTVLQIGVNNDTNDNIQLYSGNMVMLHGYGNELGIEFPANIWGGSDHAFIRYLRQNGSDTRLQIVNTNDSNDEIELYSNAMTLIQGNGSNPIGFQFQGNRWGGGGDTAYIRYRSEGGENTRFEIVVGNDADDNMLLSASGGITLQGNVNVTGRLTAGNNGLSVTHPSAGDAPCPGGWTAYGDLCFLNSRRNANDWGVGDHWCRTQQGAHMCTDAEVSGIRGWRGWFGGNFWYADAVGDDVALYHNCNCGDYWYNHDGDAGKGGHRHAYCCRSR